MHTGTQEDADKYVARIERLEEEATYVNEDYVKVDEQVGRRKSLELMNKFMEFMT